MDKIIDDIVSIDLECSKRVEEAKKKKQDVQANMNAKKKEIYDSFVKLEAKIQETRVKNEQEYKESLNQLSSLYEKNKDEWVSTIVNRCKEI